MNLNPDPLALKLFLLHCLGSKSGEPRTQGKIKEIYSTDGLREWKEKYSGGGCSGFDRDSEFNSELGDTPLKVMVDVL